METVVVMDVCSCKATASRAASLELSMLPLTRKVVALEAEHVTRGLFVKQHRTDAFVVMIRKYIQQLTEVRAGMQKA